MRARIVTLGDPLWAETVRRLEADVYFLPEYHRVYETHGDGTALALVAEERADVLLHPFMLRPITRVGSEPVIDELYDLESVNGYTGPLSTTVEPGFLSAAWAAFHDWCVDHRVVAEFVRFHPLLQNHGLADPEATVTRDRDLVVLELDEGLWDRYPSVQRNMVRKAQRLALRVVEGGDPEWEEFQRLYRLTMERVGARRSLRFDDAYFSELRSALRDHVRVFVVHDADAVVSGAVFLLYGDYIHYHLAASDPVLRRGSGSNNLLLHTVAEWAASRGLRWMQLGGGRTPHPNDELLRFKSSVSTGRRSFYLGQRIHDAARMAELVARWRRQSTLADVPSYFFLYRLDPLVGDAG